MPPYKKHASTRQRANKASTAATLYPRNADEIVIPTLPDLVDLDGNVTEWRPETLEWWDEVWCSPMAGEFVDSDVQGLYRLAILVENFWREPSAKNHAEIRISQQEYGLTPYSRRRLEWTVESAEDAKARGRRREAVPPPQPMPTNDPRLSIVG